MIVGGVAYALAGGGPWRPAPPHPPHPPSGVLLPGPADPAHARPYGPGAPGQYPPGPGPAGPGGPMAPGPATGYPTPPPRLPSHTPAGPSPRMRQVADELDELGELLRKEEDDR